uniref:NADH-ubiquinone oxidoreductase chain 6 n=1 Tax=Crocodylus palustris TaxID=184238 RepID=E3T1K4_CROPL|nr:NADH dehydrogenase subunit 6 [Crocodylus palustris]ACZ02717.1 NADH dehydrogenase subunit 6 [Crocodylus palustris]ADQ52669.1 NADH dehydrogenase subunit 6 [Crocodylus palustris]QOI74403.1 NADH dehydrogenase subunit 6 [Crocodylus palustris]
MGITFFLLCCLMMISVVLVASGVTIHYGVVSLLFAAMFGSGLLVAGGGSFMPLVVLLIYLGGLLVVFAFCVGFTDDKYCELWGAGGSKVSAYVCGAGLGIGGYCMYNSTWAEALGCFVDSVETWGGDMNNEFLGAGLFYLSGWGLLILSGWALLVVLFTIMILVRGRHRGALRSL